MEKVNIQELRKSGGGRCGKRVYTMGSGRSNKSNKRIHLRQKKNRVKDNFAQGQICWK